MAVANSGFTKWAESVETEARRTLGRPDGDVGWLLGAPEDMRECFEDGMNPVEYVKAQIEQPE
ncbi:hypothetical protein [Burkholderia metallica]|uniref:Antitoxin VbhA domain-containing protein n=1 Tax=Burkholderia metallica TaxID=488729 RepID=A0ABT8PI03_9BURK|nr:hypothetical protein [Burkholderia metallica]MCA8002752.1 hypothetical protein [Burkholderia metallica]MDN7934639.1 hypothetical protein [Burkholderia metallica]